MEEKNLDPVQTGIENNEPAVSEIPELPVQEVEEIIVAEVEPLDEETAEPAAEVNIPEPPKDIPAEPKPQPETVPPVTNVKDMMAQDTHKEKIALIIGVIGVIFLLLGTLGILRPIFTFVSFALGITAGVLAWQSKELNRFVLVGLIIAVSQVILAAFSMCSYLNDLLTVRSWERTFYEQPAWGYEEFYDDDYGYDANDGVFEFFD